MTARRATNKGAPAPVEAFKSHGADFIVRDNLADLVEAMNALVGDNLLKLEFLKAQIEARDREIDNPYVKDAQVMNLHNARKYIGDRLTRTAKPHRILDPAHGPLIAVKLNILVRKTLGGFETDLESRVFGGDGRIIPGLYAAGEAAGFGGGGMHGYRSLEGTFLGVCFLDATPDAQRRKRSSKRLLAGKYPISREQQGTGAARGAAIGSNRNSIGEQYDHPAFRYRPAHEPGRCPWQHRLSRGRRRQQSGRRKRNQADAGGTFDHRWPSRKSRKRQIEAVDGDDLSHRHEELR
jgi:hypothetical protein